MGQEVEVSAKTKDQIENSWWKAIVTRTNGDGSFIYVRYEDGVEEILESSRVRKISTQVPPSYILIFSVGRNFPTYPLV